MRVKKVALFFFGLLFLSLVIYKEPYLFSSFRNFLNGFSTESFQPSEDSLDVSDKSAENKECIAQGDIEYLYYYEPDPKDYKNNKFGLYIYAENKKFFELAQNLVNSNGGDWGYVLIPYNVKDRDKEKWTRVFDQLLRKRLIPIIQLWDVDPENYQEQTQGAAEFLNEFVWPVRTRYISVYNEPNDANFWKGTVDPEEYAIILRYTIAAFKKENLDFFIMNGALNASAADSSTSMDSERYMRLMNEAVPGIFEQLDGWASHSYPQPNFSGSPNDKGRWSIRAYERELEFLKNEIGVENDLPVFITETGWAHAEGDSYNPSYLSVKEAASYIKTAFEKVWLPDDRVQAVIPFTVWYEPPFDHFSWVNKDGIPYEHYEVVKSMKKVKGNPPRLEIGKLTSVGCP